MYAVVGCSNCEALWVVEGRPDTTSCPRCETRHRHKKLKKFVTCDTAEAAKDARSRLLAKRGGFADAARDLDSFERLGETAMESGMSDEAFLAASGLDPDEVEAAGERAESGRERSLSREEAVRTALRELDAPDGTAVREFAADHGVPADYVDRLLGKLERAGEVTRTSDGGYRLL
ncbi:DUF5817 domain-containing protein [Haloglomus litoreum]|uniref:DUF5817 domain-containing protein n=1 Tax=Haloglomus litoreum TaxID=3034026 RepID=UPI0023E8642B|nr:DUF5817 domain-containing protein [Haloglomus sp. DT116]